MWPIGSGKCNPKSLFNGALKKKEKEKDNRYKVREAMAFAIAIGLNMAVSNTEKRVSDQFLHWLIIIYTRINNNIAMCF